jgi:hypothetical protein
MDLEARLDFLAVVDRIGEARAAVDAAAAVLLRCPPAAALDGYSVVQQRMVAEVGRRASPCVCLSCQATD